MKITDASHAVRILEALAEQKWAEWDNPNYRVNGIPKMELALVEGVEVFLQRINNGVPGHKGMPPIDRMEEQQEIAIDLARTYAPHMESAGMTLPE